MTTRSWWSNCGVGDGTDAELAAIDRLEAEIAPLTANLTRIRELIGTLEMCHHKAERWVSNIVDAIATGQTAKGLGTRAFGQVHPVEVVAKNACAALSAWVAGCPGAAIEVKIGAIPASRMFACLGDRSPLKEWQVQRVIEKIRSWTDWPRCAQDPSTQYTWMAYGRSQCPVEFQEHEAFWRQTVETFPFPDLRGVDGGEFSLGLAIDLLWTCHWNFVENLQIVLEVIGGNARPARPFGACQWNLVLAPLRPRMKVVAETLRVFCGEPRQDREIDTRLLSRLGESTRAKQWLAASLGKTLRLQLQL